MDPHIYHALMETFLAAQRTAALMDAEFPPEIMTYKWVDARHSPDPWTAVHSHYMNQNCHRALLDALSTRADLAVVIEKLNTCIEHAKAEGRPIDLSLKKQKRVDP